MVRTTWERSATDRWGTPLLLLPRLPQDLPLTHIGMPKSVSDRVRSDRAGWNFFSSHISSGCRSLPVARLKPWTLGVKHAD